MTAQSVGGEVRFQTSASTGPARRWLRTHEQLAREATLIGDTLVGRLDLVISYAPPQHLLGALFGEWLPQLRDVPVVQAWTDLFSFPSVPSGTRVLIVCVPTAWHMLQRHWKALGSARSVVALHSAAAPPPTAYDLVHETAPLLRAHEILGSTETGGIAHRPIDPDDRQVPWQAFEDVTLVRGNGRTTPGRGEELVIASPRIGRPETADSPPGQWATGDLVEYTGRARFRLVGRKSSLVKVDGRRVHLSLLNDRLRTGMPGAEFATLPIHDDTLTGEGYAVFWSPGSSDVDLSHIRSALAEFPAPAYIVRIPSVPTTAAGKPDTRQLADLLRSRIAGVRDHDDE